MPTWPNVATARDLRLTGPAAMPVAAVAVSESRLRRLAVVSGVLALVSVPLFAGLGAWPLMDPDEGRNAEVAREMLASGSWIVPHFNGLPFLDKPVGLFWMIAASFRLVGIGELGARLPSAVGAVCLLLATFAIARRLLGTRHALVAAVVLGTAPLVMIFARLTIFDMPFTALVTLTIWALVEGRLSTENRRWYVLAGLAMGGAMLTKGPVGVAVPMLAWAAARGSLPQPDGPRGRAPALVVSLVFLAVVVPWIVAVAIREPGFLRYAVIDETLLRFTAPERFNRAGPFYYPTGVLLAGFGAWSVVLAAVVPGLLRRARDGYPEAQAIHFTVRMIVAILVLFTLSASKRPGYVLPALVPLSILTSVGILEAPGRVVAAIRGLAVGAVAMGVILALCGLGGGWSIREALGEASPAITAEVLLAGGTVLLVWGTLAAVISRDRPWVAFVMAGALMPAICAALLGPLRPYAEGRSVRALARQVDPDAEVIAYRSFPTSLPFYLRRPVPLASETGRELTSNYVLSQHDRFLDSGLLEHPRDFWARLEATPPVYVLAGIPWERRLQRRSSRPLVRVGQDGRHVLLVTR
jgi:4-amino-4-deoxy-L-arabinose transferase-like glycosyltransferase